MNVIIIKRHHGALCNSDKSKHDSFIAVKTKCLKTTELETRCSFA